MSLTKAIKVIVLLGLTFCLSELRTEGDEIKPKAIPKINITKPVKFVVINDVHLWFERELGPANPVFNVLKMTKESEDILLRAVELIKHQKPDFVILNGDTTNNGEKVNHLRVAEILNDLERNGIKVFVNTGNHDIAQEEKLPEKFRTTVDDYLKIYSPFGRNEAILSDTKDSSLSYVAEITPELWLLMIDASIYEPKPSVDGRLKKETRGWIEGVLDMAREKKKLVIAAMHHGLLENFPDQAKLLDRFVIDDYEYIARFLALNGVKTIFTAHFHVQDITSKIFDDKEGNYFIYDIETGSTVTWPCYYRVVEITDDKMIIRSKKIDSIPSVKGSFQDYAREFLKKNLTVYGSSLFKKYVPQEDLSKYGTLWAESYMLHARGDEPIGKEIEWPKIDLTNAKHEVVRGFEENKGLIENMRQELPPPDLDAEIDLNSGQYKNTSRE